VIDAISGSLDRTSGALGTAEQSTRSAADLAMRRAESEAKDGRTWANHPASTSGEGRLMRARFAFLQSAATLAKDVEVRWIASLSGRRTELVRRVETLRTRIVPADAAQFPAAEQARRIDIQRIEIEAEEGDAIGQVHLAGASRTSGRVSGRASAGSLSPSRP
jgi:hypothetical protein